MTDRVKAFTVVLDDDYRIDDVEALQNAIAMMKGVLKVTPVITDGSDYVNRVRIHHELVAKIWEILKKP